MIKIFDSNTDSWWGEKVNFVDDNNVLIGYDMWEQCCERYGWYITEGQTNYRLAELDREDEQPSDTPDLVDYRFDTRWYQKADADSTLDSELAVYIFRMVADGKPDLYLHIYNAHNGYYSHGLTVTVDGSLVIDDFI